MEAGSSAADRCFASIFLSRKTIVFSKSFCFEAAAGDLYASAALVSLMFSKKLFRYLARLSPVNNHAHFLKGVSKISCLTVLFAHHCWLASGEVALAFDCLACGRGRRPR